MARPTYFQRAAGMRSPLQYLMPRQSWMPRPEEAAEAVSTARANTPGAARNDAARPRKPDELQVAAPALAAEQREARSESLPRLRASDTRPAPVPAAAIAPVLEARGGPRDMAPRGVSRPRGERERHESAAVPATVVSAANAVVPPPEVPRESPATRLSVTDVHERIVRTHIQHDVNRSGSESASIGAAVEIRDEPLLEREAKRAPEPSIQHRRQLDAAEHDAQTVSAPPAAPPAQSEEPGVAVFRRHAGEREANLPFAESEAPAPRRTRAKKAKQEAEPEVHIGVLEIHVAPPPSQQQAESERHSQALAKPDRPLARGFASTIGLRQG